jgi:hypothetical protein
MSDSAASVTHRSDDGHPAGRRSENRSTSIDIPTHRDRVEQEDSLIRERQDNSRRPPAAAPAASR